MIMKSPECIGDYMLGTRDLYSVFNDWKPIRIQINRRHRQLIVFVKNRCVSITIFIENTIHQVGLTSLSDP